MNTLGRLFRISFVGSSHEDEVSILIEGVKPGIKLTEDDFIEVLNRRRPKEEYETLRVETDQIIIRNGVFNGYTTGVPILISVINKKANSVEYKNLVYHPRPSHSDYVYSLKFKGYNDYRGGGQSSGRMTVLFCIGYVIASKVKKFNIDAKIYSVKNEKDPSKFELIFKEAKEKNDTVGGVCKIVVKDLMPCLGEPFFDSLESVLAHALFSVPAVKAVSFGSIIDDISLYGSEFNDVIINKNGKTKTNHNGGINAGISNGNDLEIYVYIKPISSIKKEQNTFNFHENKIMPLIINGRHDSSILNRVLVVLESVVGIVLTDMYLLNEVKNESNNI